jgi:hypothetical protein
MPVAPIPAAVTATSASHRCSWESVAIQREHAAARHKLGREFEADERHDAAGQLAIPCEHVGVAASRQPKRWKDHRQSSDGCDHRELPSIGLFVERRTRRIDHTGSSHEFAARPERVAGDSESLLPRAVVDKLHIARVHVDGGRDASRGCAGNVRRESVPVDPSIGSEGEEDCRHATNATPRPNERGGIESEKGDAALLHVLSVT